MLCYCECDSVCCCCCIGICNVIDVIGICICMWGGNVNLWMIVGFGDCDVFVGGV